MGSKAAVALTPREQIRGALNQLIDSGKKFTGEDVWPLLADTEITSSEHGSLLGPLVQEAVRDDLLRIADWTRTETSRKKSRMVPVWRRNKRRKVGV